MAVYAHSLMLQGGSFADVSYGVFKAVVAIILWGGASIGFWIRPLKWFERAFAFASACFLVAAVPFTDQIGFAMTALLIVWHVMRMRTRKPRAVVA